MRKRAVLYSLLSVMILSSSLAYAQMGRGMSFPKIFGDWNAKLGSGASYQIDSEGKDKPTRFDVAIVGEEKVDGQTGHWLEMSFEGARESRGGVTIKYLFVKQGDDISIKKFIMKPPDRPAMEIPADMMAMAGSAIEKESFTWKNKAKHIGTETISTPAGSFSCEHYQTVTNGETHDVWISNKVSPYGLIKSKGPKSSMTIQKVLTDQKSKITETPQKMDFPMMKKSPQ